MKLSKKLLIICLTLIIIPSLLLTGAWLAMRTMQERQIRKQFEMTGRVDPYSFSAVQRFDAMRTAMVNGVTEARKENSDCVLDKEYLRTGLAGRNLLLRRLTRLGRRAGISREEPACGR